MQHKWKDGYKCVRCGKVSTNDDLHDWEFFSSTTTELLGGIPDYYADITKSGYRCRECGATKDESVTES